VKNATHIGWLLAGALVWPFMATTACSDDDNGTKIDAQVSDAQTDSSVTDGGVDSAVQHDGTVDSGAVDAEVLGCTGDSPAEPQATGACCQTAADCLGGTCLGGYCTSTGCQSDDDCDEAVTGPFAAGTKFNCSQNNIGYLNFCGPGSLQSCGGQSDNPCPTGESCVLGWNDQAMGPGDNVLTGVCITDMGGSGLTPAGGQCDEHSDNFDYQCETTSFLLSSCMGRRCTTACDVDNSTNTCPTGMECSGPLALDGGTKTLLASGVCAGALCGHLTFTDNPDQDVRIPGLDADCPTGQVCTTFMVTGTEGETYEMRCIPEVSTYGGAGDACEHAEKFAQFCNSNLCLQMSATWDAHGGNCTTDDDCPSDQVCASASNPNFPKRCSAKPDPGFCSVMCRTDTDCPTMGGHPSYCVEIGVGALPNGQTGYITACYPEQELFEQTPTTCQKESDCDTAAGEGCVRISNHSTLQVCKAIITADPTGTDCTTGGQPDCGANEACIDNGDNTKRCTPVLSVGDSCDPADNRCMSGVCLDSDFATDDQGTPTNTFCSASCTTTTDCGANEVCENILWAQNDPDTSGDDVVSGLCRPMRVRHDTDACANDGDCGGGKTCDTVTGRCYTSSAVWGGPCIDDTDCGQNGLCATDAPGGMCYLPGCDPAHGNADCGGGDTVCSTNSPVGVCVEDCTTNTDCTRNGAGYVCNNGACEAP